MFAVCVLLKIKPGEMDRFLPLIKDNAATSLDREVGCRRFDICTDRECPDEVFLYEVYDSAEAFDDHKATDHYAEFDAAASQLVAEKTVKTYRSVG